MDALNTSVKFEVRSFTRSWDNRGTRKIWEVPGYVTPLFSQIFNRLLFAWTKFEVRSFTRSWDNSEYFKKFGPSLYTLTHPFLQNFSWAYVRMDPANIPAKFEVPSFSRSWNNSDCIFGVGLRTPNLREGEAVGVRDGTVRKSVCNFL